VEGFVPLCHASAWPCWRSGWWCHARWLGRRRGAPRALDARGARFQPGPWLGLEMVLRIRPELPSIGSLELGRAPKSQVEAKGVLRFRPILCRRLRASIPDGYSPLSDPRGIGREVLTLGLNIFLCLSLVTITTRLTIMSTSSLPDRTLNWDYMLNWQW
jgi:hypothetical protein